MKETERGRKRRKETERDRKRQKETERRGKAEGRKKKEERRKKKEERRKKKGERRKKKEERKGGFGGFSTSRGACGLSGSSSLGCLRSFSGLSSSSGLNWLVLNFRKIYTEKTFSYPPPRKELCTKYTAPVLVATQEGNVSDGFWTYLRLEWFAWFGWFAGF